MTPYWITKRKLTRAVNQAIADGKIPDARHEYYFCKPGEYGLHWPDQCITAIINRRLDDTIFISYAERYERGSHYHGWLVKHEL